MCNNILCLPTFRSSLFNFLSFLSLTKIESITSPTLIIHGTDDEVVGIDHGRRLYSRLKYPLKPLWVEGAGHNDIELFHEYVERLDKFFKQDLFSNGCSGTPADSPDAPMPKSYNSKARPASTSIEESSVSSILAPPGTNGRGSGLFNDVDNNKS